MRQGFASTWDERAIVVEAVKTMEELSHTQNAAVLDDFDVVLIAIEESGVLRICFGETAR